MAVIIYLQINRAIKGKVFKIRKITALDAIEEAVGRAVEQGRPVHFATGVGGITDQYTAQTLAGLDVMAHTAGLCAKLGARFIYTAAKAMVLPVVSDVLQTEYKKAGITEEYDEVDTIRYVGDDQRAMMAAGMDNITREKVSTNVMVGAFFWETIILADHAAGEGAMQIGGTARMFQLPVMVACMDYVMLFEEMFVAGAYLSGDIPQIGSIAGQDYCKYMVLALALISILVSFIPSARDVFINLLTM